MTTLLIVDDNAPLAADLAEILECDGYQVEAVHSGEAALGRLERGGVDLVLMDIRMPGLSGVETLIELRSRGVSVPVVAMTAYTDDATLERGLQAGLRAVLAKPIDFSRLSRVLGEAAANR